MTKVIYQQEALRRSDKIRYDMVLSADISWDKCPLFGLWALTRNVLSALGLRVETFCDLVEEVRQMTSIFLTIYFIFLGGFSF